MSFLLWEFEHLSQSVSLCDFDHCEKMSEINGKDNTVCSLTFRFYIPLSHTHTLYDNVSFDNKQNKDKNVFIQIDEKIYKE